MIRVGIDEAGRGAWAGPVVVAVVSGTDEALAFCVDSKSITSLNRERLLLKIYKQADQINVGFINSFTIDELGLSMALTLASQRAFSPFSKQNLPIIMDGPFNFLKMEGQNIQTVIKADISVPQVSAASIVAKVYRDRWMRLAESSYHDWSFSSHKGYGTQKHMAELGAYGLSAIHRRSVKPVKAIYESNHNR